MPTSSPWNSTTPHSNQLLRRGCPPSGEAEDGGAKPGAQSILISIRIITNNHAVMLFDFKKSKKNPCSVFLFVWLGVVVPSSTLFYFELFQTGK
jgi:hypothetical protein